MKRVPSRGKVPIPNILTASRIFAAPLLAFAVLSKDAPWLALAITVIAALSDALDGAIARRCGQISDLGAALDPVADKLFVATALLLLVADGSLRGASIWAVLIVLWRELSILTLREHARSLGLRASVSTWAKVKTAAQYGATSTLFAARLPLESAPFLSEAGNTLLWAAAVLSLYTGADYFWQAWRKSWK
jgi:cardiolipin synthase (CMP-forming)